MHESHEACVVDPYGGIDSDLELEPIQCKYEEYEETKTEHMSIGHTAVGYMVFL